MTRSRYLKHTGRSPRSRGVYGHSVPVGRSWVGSSPLARGLPSLDDTRCATYGIIPQGVGKVGSGGWLGDELDGAFWLS